MRHLRLSLALFAIMLGLTVSGSLSADEKAAKKETAAMMGGVLDGKAFSGELGKKGKEKGDKDDLIFKEGKFRSTACDSYGFTEAPYTATVKEDLITFEATAMSPTDGKMEWKGTVKGDKLEGTALWTPPGKSSVEHWVKAALQKEHAGKELKEGEKEHGGKEMK